MSLLERSIGGVVGPILKRRLCAGGFVRTPSRRLMIVTRATGDHPSALRAYLPCSSI